MKAILLSLLLTGASQAWTVTPLLTPEPPVTSNLTSCASIGFNLDGSIYGTCQYRQGNCGRYCFPAVVRYAILWGADASTVTVVAPCGSTTAGLAGRTVTSYVAPYTFATCHVAFDPTGITVGIPYGSYSWQVTYYYYVTTSPSGAELVNGQTQSFLATP